MASIQNVTLQIVENQGAAAALVTYTIFGSATDVARRQTYIESIELIGVDEGAGEDGQNEPIPGVRFDGSVTFPVATAIQARLLALPAKALDEDFSADPFGSPQEEDEIRARVTLVATSPATVIADSNIFFRGGPINKVSPAIPA